MLCRLVKMERNCHLLLLLEKFMHCVSFTLLPPTGLLLLLVGGREVLADAVYPTLVEALLADT